MDLDKAAIEAVKQGDRNRFSELIDRHKRMVHAVAWSYLGDADLCEDAAQETFIRAFRYLRALRDADRFPAWLGRIARNVSATFRRKRRAELEMRHRWQLEQPDEAAPPADTGADESLSDALSGALAELPESHRECLVLFYIEDKSIAETAAVLGIGEGAAKTRLHRARLALRGRLEQQIEGSLQRLAPRKEFSASVMLLLPQQPLGWAAAGGGGSVLAGLGSLLAKSLSGVFFILWMAAYQAAFFYLFKRWFARLLSANFARKPENDFRKDVLRRDTITQTVAALLMMVAVVFLLHFQMKGQVSPLLLFQILAIYVGWAFVRSLRLLRVNRSVYVQGQVLSLFVFLIAQTLIGFFGGSMILFIAALLFLNIAFLFTNRKMPCRMDYSLFLRQATGLLGNPQEDLNLSRPATEPEMRAFARFLGAQYLVRDYRIKGASMILWLAPVRNTISQLYLCIEPKASSVVHADGSCQVCLSAGERKSLAKILGRTVDQVEIEAGVARALQASLALFLRGEQDEARRILSTVGDDEIFVGSYSKSKAYRMQHGLAIVCGAGLLIFMSLTPGAWRSDFRWFTEWNPKPVSQTMARQAMGEWLHDSSKPTRPDLLELWRGPAFPSLAMIGPKNAVPYKQAVRDALRMDFDERQQGAIDCRIVNGLLNPTLLYHAVSTPILSPPELAALGFDRGRVRGVVLGFSKASKNKRPNPTSEMLTIERKTRTVRDSYDYQEYRGLDIEIFAFRLYLLKAFTCLDLVNREALLKTIAGHQISPGRGPEAGYQVVDTTHFAGLFHMGRCDLRETWASIWALDILGGLDRIDRKACVEGILRLYKGGGVFEMTIPGKPGPMTREEDAFYAMESLARLNALDCIPDFAKWRFHPLTQTVTSKTDTGYSTRPGFVTSAALRAMAFQERLETLRQQHPVGRVAVNAPLAE